jgi:hypothetical protein
MISNNLITAGVPSKAIEESFDIQGENIDDISPIRLRPGDPPALIERANKEPNWDYLQDDPYERSDKDMIETERVLN